MRQYSFKETTFLINGGEITGFSDDDDSIVARRLEDTITHIVGNKGEMAIAISASRAGEFVFKLLQTSDDNKTLSRLMSAAEEGVFVPIFVGFKDNLGNDLYTGAKGYLTKPADATRGKSLQMQEWRVVVERLDLLHGGTDAL